MSDHIFHPDLKIVPLSQLKLQEAIQTTRLDKLVESIRKDGVLRHPPIATNFSKSRYLHLDGANRLSAMKLLGYKTCLVQLVDYADPTHIHLTSWSHLVTFDKQEFLSSLQKTDNIKIISHKSFNHKLLLKTNVLCLVQFSDKSVYECVFAKGPFTSYVEHIGKIVALYKNNQVERVFSASPWTQQNIHVRFDRFPEHTMFLAFPTFSPQQVMTLVDRGVLMPPGLTRHVVYRRKLNVNLPLSYLKITPIEKANEELQKFLQARTVRLYEEPVIYFE